MSEQLSELLDIPLFPFSNSPFAFHPTFKYTFVASILYNVSNQLASVQLARSVLLKCSVS